MNKRIQEAREIMEEYLNFIKKFNDDYRPIYEGEFKEAVQNLKKATEGFERNLELIKSIREKVKELNERMERDGYPERKEEIGKYISSEKMRVESSLSAFQNMERELEFIETVNSYASEDFVDMRKAICDAISLFEVALTLPEGSITDLKGKIDVALSEAGMLVLHMNEARVSSNRDYHRVVKSFKSIMDTLEKEEKLLRF